MSKLLFELFQSPARTGVLHLLLKVRITASVRELALRCGLSHQAVRKEVEHLEQLGLATVRGQGAAKLVTANWEHPANQHLLALFDVEAPTPMVDDALVREALVAYGAPLLGNGPQAHWSLEETIARALRVARHDATVMRVVPVVLAKNRNELDGQELLRAARKYQVKAELGMILDLSDELLGTQTFKDLVERLNDKRRHVWQFFPEVKNRFEVELAKSNAFEVAQRWHFHTNMTRDSFESLLSKHCPEFKHA